MEEDAAVSRVRYERLAVGGGAALRGLPPGPARTLWMGLACARLPAPPPRGLVNCAICWYAFEPTGMYPFAVGTTYATGDAA